MTGPFKNAILMGLFSLSLLTSAALMFSVQPMVGKMLLPIVGGTPAGWIVAMAFFQLALLAGYTLAWGLSRLSAPVHGLAYIGALALGVLFLPVSINAVAAQDTLGAGGTFLLLALCIGVPFMALSTTATTLQRMFSATSHPAARDPYFLYAASNLGSFSGLLLYPLLIEPRLALGAQTSAWFVVYAALIVLAGLCLTCIPWRNAKTAVNGGTPAMAAPLTNTRRLQWVVWGFVPASLLMGYTSFITRDIYSAPMIWVLPLAVYLLTFILAFRSPSLVSAAKLATPYLIAVSISLIVIALATSLLRVTLLPVGLHLLALGIIALAFHTRLYEDRPLNSERQLAAFYLLISLGGALAGIFNAFVAPFIFDSSLELPVVLLLSTALHPRFNQSMTATSYAALGFALLSVIGYTAAVLWDPENAKGLLVIGMLSMLCGLVHPRTLFICGVIFMGLHMTSQVGDTLDKSRNFYGTISIYDSMITDKDGMEFMARHINHGTTLHGFQVLDPAFALHPTSYYGAVHGVFERLSPRRALVMGLGAGTMQCLARPSTDLTFIEIDPAVIDAAQKHFTYLSKCQDGKLARILTGDGRLEMQKLDGETFDLIAVDVFSSDYIPAHLMTREALALYVERLTPGGVLLFHISNNFFDLTPVLTALALDAGLEHRVMTKMTVPDSFERPSVWYAMSRDKRVLDRVAPPKDGWVGAVPKDGIRMWTDDYTDYISILRKGLFNFGRSKNPVTEATEPPVTQ